MIMFFCLLVFRYPRRLGYLFPYSQATDAFSFKKVNHVVGAKIRLLRKNDNSNVNSDNKLLKTIINIPLLLGVAKDKNESSRKEGEIW